MSLRQKQINEILGYHDNINRDVFEREKKHVYYSGLQELQPREKDLVVEAELKQRVQSIQYDIQNIAQSIHYVPSATLVSTIGRAYEEEEGERGRYKPAVEQSTLARQKSGKENFDRMFSFLTKLIRDWNNLTDYYLIKTQQNRYSDAQESALKDSITTLVDPLKDLLQKVVLLKPVTHDYYKIYNPIATLLRIVESGDLSKLPPSIVGESGIIESQEPEPLKDLQEKTEREAQEFEKRYREVDERVTDLQRELMLPHTDDEKRQLQAELASSKRMAEHYREQYDVTSRKFQGYPRVVRKRPEYSRETLSLVDNKIADYNIRLKDIELMVPSNKAEKTAIDRLKSWYASEKEKLEKFKMSGDLKINTTGSHADRGASPARVSGKERYDPESGFIDEETLTDKLKRQIKRRIPGSPLDKQLQNILAKLTPRNRRIIEEGESKEAQPERESKDEEPYGRSEFRLSRDATPSESRRFEPRPGEREYLANGQFANFYHEIVSNDAMSRPNKTALGMRLSTAVARGALNRSEYNTLTDMLASVPEVEEERGEGKPETRGGLAPRPASEPRRTKKKGGAVPLGNFPDEATLAPYISKHLKPSRFKNTKIADDTSSESESESGSSSSEEPVTGGRKKRCKGSAKPVILNSPDKDLWFL
jgi:hypothetical protein